MDKDKERRDPFLRLTCLQIGLGLLFFGVVFSVFHWGGERFDGVLEEYSSLTEDDLGPTSVDFFNIGSIWEKKDETTAPPTAGPEPSELPTAAAEETSSTPEETTDAEAEAAVSLLPASGGAPLMQMDLMRTETEAVLPVSGTVTSGYGERIHPIFGKTGFHSGVDLAAAEGTAVHAALDGTVVDVGVGEVSGRYVKIAHAGGRETLYCHLSAQNVEKGVTVRKGDVIGFVGQTGLATGPHLHFELKINGEKVDPAPFLEEAADVFSDR